MSAADPSSPRRLRAARRVGSGTLLVAAALAVAGCAAGTSTGPSDSPCAIPAQEGVVPPSGCVAYDPEAGMAANDAYRQRFEISDEAQAAGGALAGPVQDALTAQQQAGTPFTVDDVTSVLVTAGFAPDGIQVREDWAILFGAEYSSSADSLASCVYGSASADAVTVEVGGLIADGGCLPAQ